MSYFAKEALKNIFEAVDRSKLTDKEAHALDILANETCNVYGQRVDTTMAPLPNQEVCELVNLNDLKSCILWRGYDDVVNAVVESGLFEEELEGLTDEEVDELLAETANAIDWEGDAYCCSERGNEDITATFQRVFDDLYGSEQEGQR